MSVPRSKATHPLPLGATLHDLALIRASDLDLAALLPPSSSSPPTDASKDSEVEKSVMRSVEFAREARAALKVLHSDAVEREGARLEEVRGRLEDAVAGLDASRE